MSLENLTSTQKKTPEHELQRLRSPIRSGERKILHATAVLSVLYSTSIGYNLYQFTQSRGWNARVKLVREGYHAYQLLQEDAIFVQGIGLYIAGKRIVDEDFDRTLHHVEFYQRECKKTKKEFNEEMKQLLVPHF